MRREQLTDFLEHNGGSCCQAFMLMLHSEQEWWISAGPAPRLPSCCRVRQILKDSCQAGARRPTRVWRGGVGGKESEGRVRRERLGEESETN